MTTSPTPEIGMQVNYFDQWEGKTTRMNAVIASINNESVNLAFLDPNGDWQNKRAVTRVTQEWTENIPSGAFNGHYDFCESDKVIATAREAMTAPAPATSCCPT